MAQAALDATKVHVLEHGKDVTVYLPITKVEQAEDGTVYVYGKATGPELDSDKQIIDLKYATKAMDSWFREWGNIRQMHSPTQPPAGTAVSMDVKADGVYVRGHIVNPTAVALVNAGAYKGYSVGISDARIVRDNKALGGRIVDGDIVELSLVDRPANASCRVELAKRYKGEVRIGGALFKADSDADDATDIQKGYCLDKSNSCKCASMKADVTCVCKCANCSDSRMLEKRDFVDAEYQRFPIMKLGDVSATVASYGRADPPIPFEAFKRRLTAIAHRKGKEFVAELPENWQEDSVTKAIGVQVRKDSALAGDGVADGDTSQHSHPHGSGHGHKHDDPFHTDDGHSHLHGHTAGEMDDHEDVADGGADEATEKSAGSRYFWRKVHDTVCAAYSPEAVADAYTSVARAVRKNGTMLTDLGPAAAKAVLAMLSHEIEEDAGSGMEAGDIARLSMLYRSITDFMRSEAVEGLGSNAGYPDMMYDARAEMFKLFVAAQGKGFTVEVARGENGAVNPFPDFPGPRPGGEVQAGSYRRPYIATGHANDMASAGQSPRIPGAANVPNAQMFDRGTPTRTTGSGESDIASDVTKDATRPGPGQSGRTYYTTAARQQTMAAMQAMHDHISSMFPELCPMDPLTGKELPAGSTTTVDMKETSTPFATEGGKTQTSPGEAKKSAEIELPVVDRADKPDLEKGDDGDADDEAMKTAKGDGEPDADDIEKAAEADPTDDEGSQTDKAVRAELTKSQSRIEELERMLSDLGSQPDYSKSAYRGLAANLTTREERMTTKRESETAAQQVREQEQAAVNVSTLEVSILMKRARNANAAVRDYAVEELQRLGFTDEQLDQQGILLTKLR